VDIIFELFDLLTFWTLCLRSKISAAEVNVIKLFTTEKWYKLKRFLPNQSRNKMGHINAHGPNLLIEVQ